MAKISMKARRRASADPSPGPKQSSWDKSVEGQIEVLATKRQVAHRTEKKAKEEKKVLSDAILTKMTTAHTEKVETPKHVVLIVEQEQSSINKEKLMIGFLKLVKDAARVAGVIEAATEHTPKRFITVREK